MDIAKPSHPIWGGAEFSPSLSEGMIVPKAVGPPLVEKVRVPRCSVLFTHREGERSLSPNIKGLGVQKSGTFWWEDMRLTIVPCQAGPTRCGSFQAVCPGLLFGSWEVPGSRLACFTPPRDPLWIGGPCPWPREVGSSLAPSTRLESFGY
jgi:hypothetical protein